MCYYMYNSYQSSLNHLCVCSRESARKLRQMNREGAYADQVRSLDGTERANPWSINDHQMRGNGSDHGGTDGAVYGDMLREMNQMTLMSECSEDDLMSEEGSDQNCADDDGYGDMWREMTLLLEGSEDAASESSAVEHRAVLMEQDECDHSFVLKDDLGYVCHTCGLIDKRVETIFDFLWLEDDQMNRKGSDQSGMNDNGYGDMSRKMSQLSLMSECSKIHSADKPVGGRRNRCSSGGCVKWGKEED